MEETKKRLRRTFTEKFKKQIVDLYNAGKPRAEIVKEYGLTASTLDRWISRINQKLISYIRRSGSQCFPYTDFLSSFRYRNNHNVHYFYPFRIRFGIHFFIKNPSDVIPFIRQYSIETKECYVR